MRPKVYKFFCIAALFALGVGLVLYGSSNSITFFLTTSEIVKKKPTNIVRLGGFVKKNSIHYEALNKAVFIITDNIQDIKVEYSGAIPMLFRESQGVVLKGKMSGSIFIANQMLAKHDEQYFPPALETNKT